jgi:hypothetical protein
VTDGWIFDDNQWRGRTLDGHDGETSVHRQWGGGVFMTIEVLSRA